LWRNDQGFVGQAEAPHAVSAEESYKWKY